MGKCFACPEGDQNVADEALVDHLRNVHPDLYGDGPECWSDGAVVVHDMTLEPRDFQGGPDA